MDPFFAADSQPNIVDAIKDIKIRNANAPSGFRN